jgi:signal peptidase I
MSQFFYYHLVVTLPIYLLLSVGFAGMFKKAGKETWKAFVPVMNLMVIVDLIGRPRMWMIWFFIPVINLIFGITLSLDLVRSFGKQKFHSHFLAVVVPFLYFIWVGWNGKDKYLGKWHLDGKIPVDQRGKGWEKAWNMQGAAVQGKVAREARDWADAILFAGTAAIIIRTFLIEAFMIPTTSMEGTLKAGDFLFVSKFHYGVRMPMIPLSIPFVHNTFPFTDNVRSYIGAVTLPYARTPGLRPIERNDIVVFNYAGDDEYPDVPTLGAIPEASMKQNYIKRCVAIPGDVLEIKKQQVYINGEKGWSAPGVQHEYYVWDPNGRIGEASLVEMGFRLTPTDDNRNVFMPGDERLFSGSNFSPVVKRKGEAEMRKISMVVHMSKEKEAEMRAAFPDVKFVMDSCFLVDAQDSIAYKNNVIQSHQYATQNPELRGEVLKGLFYPKANGKFMWTLDNFGPLKLPKAGDKIPLNEDNYILYERVMRAYEHHEVKAEGGKFFIDGKEATEYTFEQDYYFMMGDNRDQSLDSRYWGFVPEDHIVGRPLMVLVNFYEWKRWFTTMSGLEP